MQGTVCAPVMRARITYMMNVLYIVPRSLEHDEACKILKGTSVSAAAQWYKLV